MRVPKILEANLQRLRLLAAFPHCGVYTKRSRPHAGFEVAALNRASCRHVRHLRAFVEVVASKMLRYRDVAAVAT